MWHCQKLKFHLEIGAVRWNISRQKWIVGVAIFFLISFFEAVLHCCGIHIVPCENKHFLDFSDWNGRQGFVIVDTSTILWTTLVRYFAFKDLITPLSMGCREDIVGGNKKIWTDFNPLISGWDGQLSVINATLRCSFSNFLIL